MHHHCEVLVPPTEDMESAVGNVLAPFEYDVGSYAFFDYFELGGLRAGAKLSVLCGPGRLCEYLDSLNSRGVLCRAESGGHVLEVPAQITVADELWREWFPELCSSCPLFGQSGRVAYDVMPLKDVPKSLMFEKFLVAFPEDWPGGSGCEFLLQCSCWNGCNFERAAWDGSLGQALELLSANDRLLPGERPPRDDWLLATVDCHS